MMTLSETLAALAGNINLSIAITEEAGGILIVFMAPGYESLKSDLDDRIVKSITVKNAKEMTIELEATP